MKTNILEVRYPSLRPSIFCRVVGQIDKVASLTNKDPYKLALAKSQNPLAGQLVPSHPSWASTKLKNGYGTTLVQ